MEIEALARIGRVGDHRLDGGRGIGGKRIEAEDAARHFAMRYSGPAGMTEQDDAENWNYATASSRGTIAQRFPFTRLVAELTTLSTVRPSSS